MKYHGILGSGRSNNEGYLFPRTQSSIVERLLEVPCFKGFLSAVSGILSVCAEPYKFKELAPLTQYHNPDPTTVTKNPEPRTKPKPENPEP